MDYTEKNKIEFYLDNNNINKLDKIVKELYESNTIDSETIDEFLKLTIFIIFMNMIKINNH